MYAQLLKEVRALKSVVENLVDELDEVETRVAKLENKEPKPKPIKPKMDEIKPKWEREGFKTKKDWNENKAHK
ncbi:hypothetical protein [Abyssisolibacter fermentans]|uniref:hypothetical protein n=1 Tax=Abyssisolibacter fermentans TaxID=1766203 RepID=UPI000833589B|nr:hypothetical protein [Abyssisolibacter fermentans]